MQYRAIISIPFEADESDVAVAAAQAFADAILDEGEEIIGQLELVYELPNGRILQQNDAFLNGIHLSRSALRTDQSD